MEVCTEVAESRAEAKNGPGKGEAMGGLMWPDWQVGRVEELEFGDGFLLVELVTLVHGKCEFYGSGF